MHKNMASYEFHCDLQDSISKLPFEISDYEIKVLDISELGLNNINIDFNKFKNLVDVNISCNTFTIEKVKSILDIPSIKILRIYGAKMHFVNKIQSLSSEVCIRYTSSHYLEDYYD